MADFLALCGYEVKSVHKLQNLTMNIIDVFLIAGYFILSIMNVLQSTPSNLLIFINAIMLARFIVKNIIEQSRIVNSASGVNKKGITLVHWTKIIIESFCMIFLVICLAEIEVKAIGLADGGQIIAVAVLVVTLLENGWTILERLYDAVPKPLLY